MGRIGKAVKALWWIAKKPVLLNRVLADEDRWRSLVGSKYGMPDGLPVITMDRLTGDRESEGSSPARETETGLGPLTFLDGGSLPTDLMLLARLAEGIPGCRYFEIGTWRGESAAILSSRVSSCHTLSLTDSEMRSMGMHEQTIASHRMFSEGLENVTHHRGDSRRFDFAGVGEKFDLVFIDGDHHYDFIRSDTRNVFRHLVHENSVVVWHDYGFHPDRVRYEVMAAILDSAGSKRAGKIYHVAHTKCAVYAGKEYQASPASFPAVPEEYYRIKISRYTM